ncbi:kinase-like domain-containing protein [Chaetomidium leptoderma]|uniref:non-specific serine/threonine protein kinase n=1 Tax=Chaetomidium leptoderma TaxID=669021 RepID=A0AAN6VCD9_9PEZI|nr:kinase-like domain-containing protein [Chaetomidium leptoderma]
MSSIPDLIRDNKLETSFDGKFTIHHYDDSDDEERSRSNQRSEYWEEGEPLARGGFGEVLLQRCVKGKRTHELRAVKKITRSISQANQFDYVSELETIAKFSHRRYSKCFVKLLGWYDTDDHLFIAMEYFPLGDLQQHMSKTGPMAEAGVCVIIYQVLEGLHYMHREGFAHRDIKPGNVLIKSQPPQRDWWVKLSDFGISKRIPGLTEMLSTVKGTPQYMAPELGTYERGSAIQVDHRAGDMWSLGEMAHRMLTATATFSSHATLFRYMIWPDSLPFQELAKHGSSGDVESFIRALMRPTPEHRLTSDKALEHAWIQPCSPLEWASLHQEHPHQRMRYSLFFFVSPSSSRLDRLI